ncbi:substrate-binding domain-containing protein [Pontivivens ytuae]|uniref:Substrate-binding domain-containing protein n=1 Tax=Pontivivens ytuae TaxID=2789856 RepID=A0A7S9LQD5_9RHOB|nr:substrate-binding domain-containing protein [Pontivivens ytuae]QPH53194.1 substrate-binding domain-containing protein [Pontivivens ytuae]
MSLRALLLALTALPASAEVITVQSTTSTQNSGLYEAILPQFEAATGIEVRVVAVGTGQAIRNAQNCDGDVLLVHATAAEEAFVEAGFGSVRHDLMYNDFIIVGPQDDPLELAGAADVAEALSRIAEARATFVSRGDDSGTHRREQALWEGAGIDASSASGTWYRETGSGMGATLNIAVGMEGYTLTDRATWLAFGNRGDLDLLFEGDDALFNQYGIIPVSPEHCPSVAAEPALRFVDWMLSEDGQDAIAAYDREGTQLFFPNAAR